MASATGSPRGFASAAADEADHAALRDEARRFRASDLGAAFPRRDVPGSPCEPGSAWSPSSGACVAVGGDIGAGAFGGFRVDDSALADPRLPTLVTLLLALAIAASLFLLVAFGVLALARLAANKLAKRRRFVSDALELVARALTGAVDVLARANDDPRDANDPGRGATDDDAPAESSPARRGIRTETTIRPSTTTPTPNPNPAGSRLGAAMGAAIARLALRPEPVGPAEAREAAGDPRGRPRGVPRSRPGRRRRVWRRLPRRRREGLRPGAIKTAAAARVGIKRRAAAAKGGERGPDPDSPSERGEEPRRDRGRDRRLRGAVLPSSSSASESQGRGGGARGGGKSLVEGGGRERIRAGRTTRAVVVFPGHPAGRRPPPGSLVSPRRGHDDDDGRGLRRRLVPTKLRREPAVAVAGHRPARVVRVAVHGRRRGSFR